MIYLLKMETLKTSETRKKIWTCLPGFFSERSESTTWPPKNIAVGPLVKKGKPPVKIYKTLLRK